eukprot:TRINITY_DN8560_c0_g3_i1.p1 TRINITY_DN8560_c0_g3~~TRINITY_DN8560_c0_g3_i1.p1  ORF type:complete len:404 (+),score=100.29 TRINITY_DN8560_c0_g3_i1:231-1442(+)
METPSGNLTNEASGSSSTSNSVELSTTEQQTPLVQPNEESKAPDANEKELIQPEEPTPMSIDTNPAVPTEQFKVEEPPKATEGALPAQTTESAQNAAKEEVRPEAVPTNAGDVAAQDANSPEAEEKRRKECIANMERLEKEFFALKEKFFSDKVEALKKEQELISSGTHHLLQKRSKDLEEARLQKTWAAEKWKEYQIQNIEALFEAEKRQAEEDYKVDIKNLREKMLDNTLERKRKLVEEKNTMNISADGTERVMTRTLRRRGGIKDTKDTASYKKRLNPPSINYTLKEAEISDDLSVLLRNTANSSYNNNSSSSTITRFSTLPAAKASDVYADKGKLHYHSQIFEKGKDIFVEAKQESGKWYGVLVVISPAEIHIKSADGTKSRFSLAQLRSGRYSISPAE